MSSVWWTDWRLSIDLPQHHSSLLEFTCLWAWNILFWPILPCSAQCSVAPWKPTWRICMTIVNNLVEAPPWTERWHAIFASARHVMDKGSKRSDIVSHGRYATAQNLTLLQVLQNCKPHQVCTRDDCSMINSNFVLRRQGWAEDSDNYGYIMLREQDKNFGSFNLAVISITLLPCLLT